MTYVCFQEKIIKYLMASNKSFITKNSQQMKD